MSTTTISATLEFFDSEGFIFNVVGSKGDIYKVGFDILDGWFCPCPDYQFRKHECKHITECKNHVDCPSDLLFCEVIA